MTDSNSRDISPDKKKEWESSSDFANYFCTYAFIYHQKQMLSDDLRMQSCRDAIFENPNHFKDKVVLDVGTGSGILSIWAAQAGARKVYAVEATDIAQQARKVIKANNQDHIITVIQSKIEDVELPEKVDVVISEWMGYFLLRESMFDSVIVARDRWLKPEGAMFPSHARNAFRKEQEQYSLHTSSWEELNAGDLIGDEVEFAKWDLKTCTLDDIKEVRAPFTMPISIMSRFGGIAGWFDVEFKGCAENPVEKEVTLTTSPFVQPTHWGQQVFPLYPPMQVCEGDVVVGDIAVMRRADNQRLMNVKFDFRIRRPEDDDESMSGPPNSAVFQIE
ncbi:Tartrate-resistant acid phosphatase type 5 [Phytophthora nicotianae]|uniref:Tartrate-resistant acid phosphatase type 5 n=1 Tax=Phytophthora nicotianae TaxID=4792 RepID=A0A0W8D8P5_PHYNI|nr:Tartrate-resistant acid phosphatase type 5 [Phytophthora nicotianae]